MKAARSAYERDREKRDRTDRQTDRQTDSSESEIDRKRRRHLFPHHVLDVEDCASQRVYVLFLGVEVAEAKGAVLAKVPFKQAKCRNHNIAMFIHVPPNKPPV